MTCKAAHHSHSGAASGAPRGGMLKQGQTWGVTIMLARLLLAIGGGEPLIMVPSVWASGACLEWLEMMMSRHDKHETCTATWCTSV
jgi:hypothetical protein